MRRYEVDWVDAFASTPMSGNGCAVVHDAAALSAQTCCAFVRETGLVECTFLEPSSVADIKIRYFLASHEIPFAGHSTIASIAAVFDRGWIKEGPCRIETGAGVMACSVTRDENGLPLVCIRQNAPEFGAFVARATIAEVVGLEENDIIGRPQVVSTGLPFCISLLRDKAALRRAKLNVRALEKFRQEIGDHNNFTEPFLVTLEGASASGDTFARLLLPPPNPPEDPFTGSASGAMAAYLWHYGYLNKTPFIAEQGHDMGRPGAAILHRIGMPQAIEGVEITGTGYVLMQGHLRL